MIIKDLLNNNNLLLINLEKDKERLKRSLDQLNKYNIGFARASHITPIRIDAIFGKTFPNINSYTLKLNASVQNNKEAVIGCGMSHMKAWKYIVDNKLPVAIILEDDFTINSSFDDALTVEIPSDFDVLFLGYAKNSWPRNACSRVQDYPIPLTESGDKRWFTFKDNKNAPIGTWAYVLTYKAALYMLNEYKLTEPVDVKIVQQKTLNDLNVYGINPSIITHCYEFGSNIGSSAFELTKRVPKLYIVLFIIFIIIVLLIPTSLNIKIVIILITILIVLIYFRRINDLDRWNKVYKNLPGVYGVDPFDPFGDVWDENTTNKIKMLLNKVFNICKTENIKCFIAFGSLLGWKRHNKKVIPWDDDMDVLVDQQDADKLIKLLKEDSSLIISDGTGKIYDSKISFKDGNEIPRYTYTYPFIDIFKYIDNKTSINIPKTNNKIDINVELVLDTFEGVDVFVPKNVDKFLNIWYSKNWNTECVSSEWNHRLDREIDKKYISKIDCDLL